MSGAVETARRDLAVARARAKTLILEARLALARAELAALHGPAQADVFRAAPEPAGGEIPRAPETSPAAPAAPTPQVKIAGVAVKTLGDEIVEALPKLVGRYPKGPTPEELAAELDLEPITLRPQLKALAEENRIRYERRADSKAYHATPIGYAPPAESLTPLQAKVFDALKARSDANGLVKISQSDLARKAQAAQGSVAATILALINKGYIRDGRTDSQRARGIEPKPPIYFVVRDRGDVSVSAGAALTTKQKSALRMLAAEAGSDGTLSQPHNELAQRCDHPIGAAGMAGVISSLAGRGYVDIERRAQPGIDPVYRLTEDGRAAAEALA